MAKIHYKPMEEPIPPKIPDWVFEDWIRECSAKSRIELDMMINYLIAKGDKLGRKGALELLARLVQLGLIGPGPVHEEWLEKRVRLT